MVNRFTRTALEHVPSPAMRARWSLPATALIALASLAPCHRATAQSAAAPHVSIQRVCIEHVRITSPRPYAEVQAALESKLQRYDDHIARMLHDGDIEGARAALERIQAPTGLTILQTLDPGAALALRGQRRRAVQYGIGNVLTATEMTRFGLAAALYAPIRVLVYEDDGGGTVIEYDQPSSTFGQFGNKEIDAVAARLDEQLRRVFDDATK